MSRVAIFIDGQNFHKLWVDQADGYPFKWPWLMDWLRQKVGGTELLGVHYYSGDIPDTGVHTFLNKIEKEEGFFVRRFPLKTMTAYCPHCEKTYEYSREKEVDTTIVADIVRMAAMNTFDIGVVMSGDADLAPALDAARVFGKKMYVAAWSNGLSKRIKLAAYGNVNLMDAIDIVQEERQLELDAIEAEKVKKDAEEKQKAAIVEVVPEPEPETHDQEESMPAIRDMKDFVDNIPETRTNFTLDELHFMDGLMAASRRLPFVGVGYFLNRWDMGEGILERQEDREAILDKLVEDNILTFEWNESGGKSIKFVTEPKNIGRSIQQKQAKQSPIGTFADILPKVTIKP